MSKNAEGHYFMSLHTGKIIHVFKRDELPIDNHVIERVESLDEDKKQPLMRREKLSFEWSLGVEIKYFYE